MEKTPPPVLVNSGCQGNRRARSRAIIFCYL
ncbi:hypothetical protein EM595_0676 [Duffyella gerundensis]|uniref:Uncharacterized protein n=1 Tax=Duffyella gerundensis TaxID=1619313 RepID=A0A0U5L153_9GAMM|nr:hypothetical protein EM595_0676 [Duffyella gerundensis]